MWKGGIVIKTKGTHRSSFVTHIFRNGCSSDGGDHNTLDWGQDTTDSTKQSKSYHPRCLLWRGRARYRPHFTDLQETSGFERGDMAIINSTPGEALWTREYPTEDHQIINGDWNPSVKASEKKKKDTF
jgi:hypothetical protein